jgi:PAS domain S-box-containing protein
MHTDVANAVPRRFTALAVALIAALALLPVVSAAEPPDPLQEPLALADGEQPSSASSTAESRIWARERGTILITGAVVAVETALVLVMLQLVRRRREAQTLVERRLQFERLLRELTLSLAAVAPDRFDAALDLALRRIAEGLGVDALWRWDFGAQAAEPWDSPTLRAGQPDRFDDVSTLPEAFRQKLRDAGCDGGPVVAVPLTLGSVAFGALFFASAGRAPMLTGRLDDLQMVATTVAGALQRKQWEGALEQSDRLKGAIVSSLPAHVAVLNRDGTIIAVNDAWRELGRANGAATDDVVPKGANYLQACRDAAREGHPGAMEALALVEAACGGERSGRQLESHRDSADGERWFLMTAEPLRRREGGAVVTFSDITERKLNEIALRESEGRFRRMADALPVAIWMSEADSSCSYVNQQWLQMTGRSLEDEIGTGWLDDVHPDDRAAAMNAYMTAFDKRESFCTEYRVRRHDGEDRWLMDAGMPRYGSDGTFHGYVGGCVDITERKEAEQTLRDVNRRLLLAQEEERRRIARELHDHLSQQVALLAIDLQQLSMTPPRSLDALVGALQEDWRRTAEIANDIHAISHRLHPSKLEALGLVATIRAHCRDVSRQSLAVHFTQANVPDAVDADVALCLFRVVEESLTNVARHSGAREARVALLGAGDDLVLRVSDSGHGFRAAAQKRRGLGLDSMRERVQLVGGTLTITSKAGEGTVVEARVTLGDSSRAQGTEPGSPQTPADAPDANDPTMSGDPRARIQRRHDRRGTVTRLSSELRDRRRRSAS